MIGVSNHKILITVKADKMACKKADKMACEKANKMAYKKVKCTCFVEVRNKAAVEAGKKPRFGPQHCTPLCATRKSGTKKKVFDDGSDNRSDMFDETEKDEVDMPPLFYDSDEEKEADYEDLFQRVFPN